MSKKVILGRKKGSRLGLGFWSGHNNIYQGLLEFYQYQYGKYREKHNRYDLLLRVITFLYNVFTCKTYKMYLIHEKCMPIIYFYKCFNVETCKINDWNTVHIYHKWICTFFIYFYCWVEKKKSINWFFARYWFIKLWINLLNVSFFFIMCFW